MFFQLFSRISIALAKKDAVTLEDLLRVIQSAYSPTPVTCTVENIYDVKSWLREYTATFQHHSHPHAFHFKLNDNGDVEMTYRPWAKAKRKEWYPKERPFIILRDIPPGKPSVLKPDLKKCPTVKTMTDCVNKLQIRMTTAQREWWETFIWEEEGKVKLWDSLSQEDYRKAGETFDLLEFHYSEPTEDEDQSPEHQERGEKLLRLMQKKENHQPVSQLSRFEFLKLQILFYRQTFREITRLQLLCFATDCMINARPLPPLFEKLTAFREIVRVTLSHKNKRNYDWFLGIL